MPHKNDGNSGLDTVLEQIGDDGWSTDYWNALFKPVRLFLIRKLSYRYRHLHRDDITDAADEVIYRLFKNFDFARLATVPRAERRITFYSFVRLTVQSVMSELHARKGLAPIRTQPQRTGRLKVPVEVVAMAFNSLSPDDQEILRHRIFQKLSYREIQAQSAMLGPVPPTINALKMRSSRATRALRQKIVQLATEGGA